MCVCVGLCTIREQLSGGDFSPSPGGSKIEVRFCDKFLWDKHLYPLSHLLGLQSGLDKKTVRIPRRLVFPQACPVKCGFPDPFPKPVRELDALAL